MTGAVGVVAVMRGCGVVRRSALAAIVVLGTFVAATGGAAPSTAQTVPPISSPPPATPTISGTVTNAQGAPVPGATVSLYYTGSSSALMGEAITAADGTYSVTTDPSYSYQVQFSAPGYTSQWYADQPTQATAASFPAFEDQDLTGIDAVLQPAGSISGHVVDDLGAPLALVHVKAQNLSDQSTNQTVTNANGDYVLDVPEGGMYRVEFVLLPGYIPAQWWNNRSNPALADPVTVTSGNVTAGIDATLPSAPVITGTVTGPDDLPTYGVTVQADYVDSSGTVQSGVTATTAADGTYSIPVNPEAVADHQFTVEFNVTGIDNLVTQWWNDKPTNATADKITVLDGQRVASIDAHLAQLSGVGRIAGTISGVGNPPGLQGASVTATNTSTGTAYGPVQTYRDGTYALDVPPGSYDVQFSAPNYDGASFSGNPVTVNDGETTPSIDAQLVPMPGSISGTVTGPDGAPLGAVGVQLFSVGPQSSTPSLLAQTTTGTDGTYTFSNVAANDQSGDPAYEVEFVAPPGLASQWFSNQPSQGAANQLTVIPGDQLTGINAQLHRSFLYGQVLGVGGPLANATVVITNYFGYPVSQTTTDLQGNFTVLDLPPGVYRAEFIPPTGSNLLPEWWNNAPDITHSSGINIAAGQTVEIRAALTTSQSISGTVSDSTGAPVGGVTVTAFAINESTGAIAYEEAHATTASDGTYTISGLHGVDYYVSFSPPPGSTYPGQWYSWATTGSPDLADAQLIAVSGGAVPVSTQLASGAHGTISGTVKDITSHPISGATVKAVASDGHTTSATATTGADGTYTLGNLDVGIETVWFLPPSGSPYRPSFWNAATWKVRPITVDQGSAITGINGTLTQNGSITGTVSGPTGPVAGATVLVTNYYGFGEASATTDSTGHYSVDGFGPGPHRLRFSAPGAVTQWWKNQPDLAHSVTLNLPNGGRATADATLAPASS